MNYRKHRVAVLLTILFSSFFAGLRAQVRWDGGGGDSQWMNAANWSNDILPGVEDDILLDNSLVMGNYVVVLPGGMQQIAVRSIRISPVSGNIIEMILPETNTAAPALVISGPGYGLEIGEGGIFRNASGITSGTSLLVSDSVRVNNGGRYIHQTRGTHAGSIAQVLSRAPGTERGEVEFDVPGTTGYTISASARVYGTLILSANAAGVARTYSSSGSNNFLVRGDLRLNNGVNYNLNLDADLIIDGNLLHYGQNLNISSGGDNTVVKLKGDLVQSGNITETSTGFPVVELCGTTIQQIAMSGNILNTVALRMNNAAGAILNSPLALPYRLELIKGKITTSDINLLTLQAGCSLTADSISTAGFIDGPLRKEGLSGEDHFLFPVGKDASMRWLALKNASGDVTVEYIKTDPRQISINYGDGIDHVSKLEYWTVTTESASGSLELSFTDPNSGGVTDLSSLRVAMLENNVWIDGGNTSVTGSAGANGSVTGNTVSLNANTKYFTLAGSDALNNPLPVQVMDFSVKTNGNINMLSWLVEGDADYFEILHSADNRMFESIGKIYAVAGRRSYQFNHMKKGTSYYQMRLMRRNEKFYESPVLVVTGSRGGSDRLMSVAVGQEILLTISSSRPKAEQGCIIDASGRVVHRFATWLNAGINKIAVPAAKLRPGIYTVRLTTNSMPFVKW